MALESAELRRAAAITTAVIGGFGAIDGILPQNHIPVDQSLELAAGTSLVTLAKTFSPSATKWDRGVGTVSLLGTGVLLGVAGLANLAGDVAASHEALSWAWAPATIPPFFFQGNSIFRKTPRAKNR